MCYVLFLLFSSPYGHDFPGDRRSFSKDWRILEFLLLQSQGGYFLVVVQYRAVGKCLVFFFLKEFRRSFCCLLGSRATMVRHCSEGDGKARFGRR